MRLAAVEQGHSRRAHLLLRTVRRVTGQDMDDVVRTALHRPQFWGRPTDRSAHHSAVPGDVLRLPHGHSEKLR